jgi:folate-binding protein YgfZ
VNVGEKSMIAPVTPDLVWFRGPDTIRFLNDLISQEIALASPGTVHRSLLLDPRGRLDHMLWVLRGDDEVGLLTDPGRGHDLASTLGRYRIRVAVEIDPSDQPAWLVVGDHAPVSGGWEKRGEGLIADISWPTLERAFVTGERPDLEEMSEQRYETLRIEAGEPRFGVDVDQGAIPQQTGLVGVSVDFDKGCFLGQELVARIDSRGGNVPARLVRLEFDNGAPDPGATLELDGSEVGTLTSAAGSLGLAMLRREVEAGATVRVGGRKALVKELRE